MANVRYWPLADIAGCAAHVRSWGKADIGCYLRESAIAVAIGGKADSCSAAQMSARDRNRRRCCGWQVDAIMQLRLP